MKKKRTQFSIFFLKTFGNMKNLIFLCNINLEF